MNFKIFTDGSCIGNPGKGGWAYWIEAQLDDGTVKHAQKVGSCSYSTNNRMELQAVIQALNCLSRNNLIGDVVIYCDSTYVTNGYNQSWIINWRKSGFNNINGDLWQKLDKLVHEQESVSFKWVRGHSGNELNEKVDAMANQAARESLNEKEDWGYVCS